MGKSRKREKYFKWVGELREAHLRTSEQAIRLVGRGLVECCLYLRSESNGKWWPPGSDVDERGEVETGRELGSSCKRKRKLGEHFSLQFYLIFSLHDGEK